jgi:predicted nuclease of restriction endonuclease-like (RecB) superfamily
MNNKKEPKKRYDPFLEDVASLLETARRIAARSVNTVLTATYWEMGRRIVLQEQSGNRRAGYGEDLIERLSADLTNRFGRGFNGTNIRSIRRFYLLYPDIIQHSLSAKSLDSIERSVKGEMETTDQKIYVGPDSKVILELMTCPFFQKMSWTHFKFLLKIEDPQAREFYRRECIRANWSTRQLNRQIDSMLYERVALSKKKAELIERENAKNMQMTTAEEEIKDPYMLEFLGFSDQVSESDLEKALIDHLEEFLLELGYGFCFVGRQKRITIDNEHYYVDLVMYHRKLRCLVLIDLKIGKLKHSDLGQMNFYLNYVRENEMIPGENPPVGIILCAEKDEAVVRYALGSITNKIFASRYKLLLPDTKEIQRELEIQRRILGSRDEKKVQR